MVHGYWSDECSVELGKGKRNEFYYIFNLLEKILKFGGSMWKIVTVVIIYILMVAAFYSNSFPRTIYKIN